MSNSTSPTPSQTSTSRPRRAVATWEHSRPPQPPEPKYVGKHLAWYCKHCTEYRCLNTTNARNHLSSKHGIQVETTVSQGSSTIAPSAFSSVSSDQINKALVHLIVRHNLSFRAVEWPAMRKLLSLAGLEKGAISSHASVSKHIGSLWLSAQDDVRIRLQSSLSAIHIAADIWTSPNRYLFLGVCAHFVDRESSQLIRILLGLRPVLTHRGEEQATELFQVFKDFGIVEKIGYFMGDNHPSNDVLCRSLEIKFERPWDATQHRLRCNGHIINLAVQAFLFDSGSNSKETDEETERQAKWTQRGSLGKLHNIAVHIRGSPARSQEFIALASRGLPLDNETRWNSWFTMLKAALEISGAIHTYLEKWLDSLRDDYLELEDWESLKEIATFLAPFHRATLATQGAGGTLDQVLVFMDILIEHYERSFERFAKSPLQLNVLRSWEVFNKYYAKADAVSTYAAALILHPSRRLTYIKRNWKESQKRAIAQVKKLWQSYRGREIMENPQIEETLELDDFDDIARKLEVIDLESADEYEAYNKQKAIPIKTSALEWWLAEERRTIWPRLSQMAIDVLSIPAMSDEPERVFSGARRTISSERMRLGMSNIEKTQCLKSWIASGLVSEVEEDEDDAQESEQGSEDDRD